MYSITMAGGHWACVAVHGAVREGKLRHYGHVVQISEVGFANRVFTKLSAVAN
jgi:hypothetical protein